jgi:hypothetical protein
MRDHGWQRTKRDLCAHTADSLVGRYDGRNSNVLIGCSLCHKRMLVVTLHEKCTYSGWHLVKGQGASFPVDRAVRVQVPVHVQGQ